eukprot:6566004-Prymnesium_polylepis.1
MSSASTVRQSGRHQSPFGRVGAGDGPPKSRSRHPPRPRITQRHSHPCTLAHRIYDTASHASERKQTADSGSKTHASKTDHRTSG